MAASSHIDRANRTHGRFIRRIVAFFVFLVTMSASVARFTAPVSASPSANRLLNYQVRLTDAAGVPVADGTKNIKISFYDAASGGTRIATDCGTVGTPVARKVVFSNGTGTVLIGDVGASGTTNCSDSSAPNAIASTLFNADLVYLGITVEADAEMTPRKRIVATAYSLNADRLDDLETSAAGGLSAYVPVTDSSGNLTLSANVTVDAGTLFVDSANNRVGVGTVTPIGRIDVVDQADATRLYIRTFSDTDSHSGSLIMRKAGGTESSPTAVTIDERLGALAFGGYDGNSYPAGAQIQVEVDGAPGDEDMPGRIMFFTTPDGSATLAERMRITNAGNVGIGTSSPEAQLNVTSTAAVVDRGILNEHYSDGTSGALFIGRKARGTEASPTTVASGDYVAAFNYRPYVTTSGFINTTSFGARVNGTVTGTSAPTEFFIRTGSTDDTDPFLNGTVKLLVDSSGNVGIGTVTPSTRLHVQKGDAGTEPTWTAPDVAIFENASGTNATVQLFSGSANNGNVCFSDNDARCRGAVVYEHANDAFAFTTATTERLRITSAGNVGIGTMSPVGELQVASSSTTNTQRGIMSSQHNNNIHAAQMHFRKSRGTNDSPTTVVSGDYIGTYHFQPFVSTSNYIITSTWGARVNGTVTGTAAPTEFFISTSSTADGDPFTNGTVRMLINSTGFVGVGDATPDAILDVDQSQNGASVVRITNATSGAAAYAGFQGNSASSSFTLRALDSAFSGDVSDRALLAAESDSSGLAFADLSSSGMFWYTGGTSSGNRRLTLSASGDFGVGQSSPNVRLDIASTTSGTTGDGIDINNLSTGDPRIAFQVSGTSHWTLGLDNSTANEDFAIADGDTLGAGNRLVIDGSSGNVGVGDSSPASLLTVGDGDRFKVSADGDVTSAFTTLDGSNTANGAGANSTTLVLNSAANFNVGNYVQVASAACVANPCFAKITNISTNTLTISPALSWSNADAVTEVHVPEVGGANLTQALANRYGRGYFVDGVVAGNGSTRFTDNLIETSGAALSINSAGTVEINGGSGSTGCSVDASGNFSCSGTVTGGGGGGGFANGGNSFGAAAVLGTNDANPLSLETNNVTYLTIASGGGFTLPVDTDWTLTGGVNGLSFDGTTFSVDATNDRVGFGTSAPEGSIHVLTNVSGATAIQGRFENTNAAGRTQFIVTSGTYPNNFFSLMTHGTTFASDHYLSDATNDAGLALLLAQGTDVSKFAIGTYNADPVSLMTSNVERLLITSTGDVGVGTIAPANRLHVVKGGTAVTDDGVGVVIVQNNAAASDTSALRIVSGATASSFLTFGDSADTDIGYIQYANASDSMAFATNTLARMTITSSGDVGIGDTTPAALFSVGSGDLFQVSASGNLTSPNDVTWTLGGGVNGLNFDSDTLSIDATNNRVGVGAAAPAAPFHIQKGTSITDVTDINAIAQYESGGNATNIWYNTKTSGAGGTNATFGWATEGTIRHGITYLTASNTLAITPDGGRDVGGSGPPTSGIFVDSSGNAGVGDNTPDALLDVAGSFQFDGSAVFGDAATDNVVFNADVNSHIIPNTDNTYDLGSTSQRWRSVHVGPGSVVVHNDTVDTNKMTLDFSGTVPRVTATSSASLEFSSSNGTVTLGASNNFSIPSGNLNMGGSTTLTSARALMNITGYAQSSGTFDFASAVTTSLANSTNAWNVDANTLVVDALNNRVGIGTSAPNTALDVNGALTLREMVMPATANSGESRLYVDSSMDRALLSNAGGLDAAVTQFAAAKPLESIEFSLAGSSGDFTLGYAFTPPSSGFITHIGVRAGAGTYTAQLWNSGGTSLASVNVTATGVGAFAYAKLSSPVAVTAGTQYVVGHYSNNVVNGYTFATSISLPMYGDGVRVDAGRWVSGNAFPTNVTTTDVYGADVVFHATPTGSQNYLTKISNDGQLVYSQAILETSAGSIGIGDSSPDSTLDVEFGGSSNGLILNNTAATGDAVVQFQNAGTAAWTVGFDDDDNDYFKIQNASSLGTTNQGLIVEPNHFVVYGGSGRRAYFGDDGSGGDIEIGSRTSGVVNVAFWNSADNARMDLYTGNLTLASEGGANRTINFGGTTSNMVMWNINGVAAPTFSTRSVGTKLVLYPGVSGSTVDYGLGIEGGTLWSSIPDTATTTQFKWYGGTTELMRLSGDAILRLEAADSGVYRNATGLFASGQANGVQFDGSGSPGILVEDGVSESGGFFANGNTSAVWSPADSNGVFSVYDEDYFSGSTPPTPEFRVRAGGSIGFKSLVGAAAQTVCANNATETGLWVLSTCSSSRRYKENIQALEVEVEKVLQLQPVSFDWKAPWTETVVVDGKERVVEHYGGYGSGVGFIAEDVAALIPELVTYDKEGNIEGLEYKLLTVYQNAVLKRHHVELARTAKYDADGTLAIGGNDGKVAYFGATGDLAIKGRLFPSDRGELQQNRSIFYDGSEILGGDVMRTDAAGWGADGSGFAEAHSSDDALEPGELVMIDTRAPKKMRRAAGGREDAPAYLLAGVVAERAGFLAGMKDVGTYPVALEGRAPSRVVGPVKIGDPITVSLTDGVGTVATAPTYVVGYALEAKDADGPGTVTVFVKTGWWNGSGIESGEAPVSLASVDALTVTENTVDFGRRVMIGVGAVEGIDGLWSIDGAGKLTAKEIAAEAVKAKEFSVEADDAKSTVGEGAIPVGNSTVTVENAAIRHDSRIFVTFYGNTERSWWISRRVDGAFDITLGALAATDLRFEYWVMQIDDKRTPPAPVSEPVQQPETPPIPSLEPAPESIPEPESAPGPALEQEPVTEPAPPS